LKTKSVLFLFVFIFFITGCSKETENVEKIAINYWEEDMKNSQDEVISNKEIINTFTNAVNDAKELDEKKIIKTKPLLSFQMLLTKGEEKGYHLWITSSGEGYIQNLFPSENRTFKLTKSSVNNLTEFINDNENMEITISDVEFEE
jgi:hypothetical protein